MNKLYLILLLCLSLNIFADGNSNVNRPELPFAHDYGVGPFLHFPPNPLVINTSYNIKILVYNAGSNSETNVPVTFYINGINTNTQNLSLSVNQVDSVNNVWTPTTAGTYNLKYISSLATDLNRTNDTVQVTVNVLSSIPLLPAFHCSTGNTYTTVLGIPGPSGDDAGLSVPIGFTFNYKAQQFTQLWICTNGYIVLGNSTTTDFNNDLCTTTANDLNMISGFWDDLNTSVSGNIQYTTQGTAPNRIFIVQWTNVGYFSGAGNVTFQIKLYESSIQFNGSDRIDIIYGPSVNNLSASGSTGINTPPGGSGNIISITPGADCGATTFSTTVCNNSLSYNIPAGTMYSFYNGLVGISPNGNEVPVVYSLAQNYPNPFNPSTTISYGIPKSGLVKLIVFDVLGREVSTLVNERKEPGMYNVSFDASNISSGVYFYKVESGDFSSIKKMVLVK